MKKIIISLLIIFIAITAAGLGGLLYVNKHLDEQAFSAGEKVVSIPKSTTLTGAVSIMNEQDLLEPTWLYEYTLKAYARLADKTLYAGTYRYDSTMTNRDIINSILSGAHQFTLKVTFPEGISYKEIAAIAKDKLNIDEIEFLKLAKNDSLLAELGIDADNIEGYLLPETYEFYMNVSAESLIRKLKKHQDEVWENVKDKAKAVGYSRHEALTMASIVEAETPVDSEKERVSGVYYNRLEKGMLLQADPTVQFAIGHKKRVLYRDLKSKNKYNTYVHAGLPPGPINCPGRKAIEAAVEPEDHDYYYFVAVGDASGKHNFSMNMAGHSKNIRIYKKNRK
jgi:peptidoglycan lytic transglycosylase G